MKLLGNILHFVAMLYLIVTFGSCAKSTVVYEGEQHEISIRTHGAPLLKAAEYTGSPFGVIAHILETGSEYFSGKFVDRSDGTWGGEQPYYWPLGDTYSLVFAGYSPFVKADGSTPVAATYDFAQKKLTFADYVIEDFGGAQSDLMYFLPQIDGSGNLVGMKYDGNAVDVTFRHALSQIQFNVTIVPGDEDLVQTGNIVLTDVVSKGSCVVSSGGLATWTRSSEDGFKADLTLSSEDPAMLIPGSSYDIKVEYKLLLPGDDLNESVALDVDATTYAPGYRYVYNINIGAAAITVDTDCMEWTEE